MAHILPSRLSDLPTYKRCNICTNITLAFIGVLPLLYVEPTPTEQVGMDWNCYFFPSPHAELTELTSSGLLA
jgi:hypothetical protein